MISIKELIFSHAIKNGWFIVVPFYRVFYFIYYYMRVLWVILKIIIIIR